MLKLNATIQQIFTGTKHDQNGIIIYLPESQDNCGSGGMLFTTTRAQMSPPHGYIGNPLLRTPFGACQVHTEEYCDQVA
jgi:hypothetical protein